MPKIERYYTIGSNLGNKSPCIEIDPERVGGSPVLHGHRLTIAKILVELLDYGLPGMSEDRIFTEEDEKNVKEAVKLIAEKIEDPHKFLDLTSD